MTEKQNAVSKIYRPVLISAPLERDTIQIILVPRSDIARLFAVEVVSIDFRGGDTNIGATRDAYRFGEDRHSRPIEAPLRAPK